MRILLVNDDGFEAEGFNVLNQIARQISSDIWRIAPEVDQSGLAHSLTLSHPLRLRQVDEKSYALRGTPTDCVIMGVRELMPSPPDLVLSGVNHGQNAANDVTYSGTAAGAMEGAILGIPSIALSQRINWFNSEKIYWETALDYGPEIIDRLINTQFDRGVFMNVNFPACSPQDVQGIEVVPQGIVDHELGIEARKDNRDKDYFWLTFKSGSLISKYRSDVSCLNENKVCITPMKPDYTDYKSLEILQKELG